jgi:hypothetical protein
VTTLPIAAQFARSATQERAHSALPEAPVRGVGERPQAPALRGRRRLTAAIEDWRTQRSRPDARPAPIEQSR